MNIFQKKSLHSWGNHEPDVDRLPKVHGRLALPELHMVRATTGITNTNFPCNIFFTKLDVILKIALSMYFLWDILGPSSLAGLAVMVLMIPANTWIGKKMKYYQFTQMRIKDRRTRF